MRRGNRLGLEKKTAGMGGRGGSSASQNTSVGSGSRPTASRIKIGSTAPSHAQMIRPKNTIGG